MYLLTLKHELTGISSGQKYFSENLWGKQLAYRRAFMKWIHVIINIQKKFGIESKISYPVISVKTTKQNEGGGLCHKSMCHIRSSQILHFLMTLWWSLLVGYMFRLEHYFIHMTSSHYIANSKMFSKSLICSLNYRGIGLLSNGYKL